MSAKTGSKEPVGPDAGKTMALRAAESALAEAKSMGAEQAIITLIATDGSYQTIWMGNPFTIRGLVEFGSETFARTFQQLSDPRL